MSDISDVYRTYDLDSCRGHLLIGANFFSLVELLTWDLISFDTGSRITMVVPIENQVLTEVHSQRSIDNMDHRYHFLTITLETYQLLKK